MPLSLNAARDRTNTVKVEYDGEEAEVTYWPNRRTPAWEDEVSQADSASAIAAALSKVIKRWEVIDENGDELPADEDTMAQLPRDFMWGIFRRINEVESAEAEGKASGSS